MVDVVGSLSHEPDILVVRPPYAVACLGVAYELRDRRVQLLRYALG